MVCSRSSTRHNSATSEDQQAENDENLLAQRVGVHSSAKKEIAFSYNSAVEAARRSNANRLKSRQYGEIRVRLNFVLEELKEEHVMCCWNEENTCCNVALIEEGIVFEHFRTQDVMNLGNTGCGITSEWHGGVHAGGTTKAALGAAACISLADNPHTPCWIGRWNWGSASAYLAASSNSSSRPTHFQNAIHKYRFVHSHGMRQGAIIGRTTQGKMQGRLDIHWTDEIFGNELVYLLSVRDRQLTEKRLLNDFHLIWYEAALSDRKKALELDAISSPRDDFVAFSEGHIIQCCMCGCIHMYCMVVALIQSWLGRHTNPL